MADPAIGRKFQNRVHHSHDGTGGIFPTQSFPHRFHALQNRHIGNRGYHPGWKGGFSMSAPHKGRALPPSICHRYPVGGYCR